MPRPAFLGHDEPVIGTPHRQFHPGQAFETSIVLQSGRTTRLPGQNQAMQRRSAAGFEIRLPPHQTVPAGFAAPTGIANPAPRSLTAARRAAADVSAVARTLIAW